MTLSLGAGAPSWLTVEEDPLNPGTWLLQGLPTETTRTEYEFGLLAQDASGATERWVQLTVNEATFPSYAVRSISGGATWTESPLSGDIVYDSSGTHFLNRAL